MAADHNRLLNQVARETLRPLGMRQKGRSRTWLDDRGWWLIVVEFQPSSWSRGSYLNVGPMWLWKPGGAHLHFDRFSRVSPFVAATHEEEWLRAAGVLVQAAASETQALRDEIAEPADAARFIRSGSASYPDLNGGIANGLAGDSEHADTLLRAYLERARGFADPGLLVRWAEHLLPLVGTDAFGESIAECIQERRVQLGLK